MNQTSYLLKDLIAFWQMKDSIHVIEAVVNLIAYQSENLHNSQKEKIILETLRKYGLFEIGYKGDRSNFLERITPIPEPEPKPEENVEWGHHVQETQLEQYNIRLLNSVIEFVNFMN